MNKNRINRIRFFLFFVMFSRWEIKFCGKWRGDGEEALDEPTVCCPIRDSYDKHRENKSAAWKLLVVVLFTSLMLQPAGSPITVHVEFLSEPMGCFWRQDSGS